MSAESSAEALRPESARDVRINTDEQQQVIDFCGKQLVVKAFAGTGKTTTLVRHAQANPGLKMLYLAYNRAIAEEARGKFPANVLCRTSHQLAYAAVGRHFRHKLRGQLRKREVMDCLGLSNWIIATDILDALQAWLCSADEALKEWHFQRAMPARGFNARQQAYRGKILEGAGLLWQCMRDPTDPVPMTHDGYLKLYQLSAPVLSPPYDVILFDEAQDANPATSDIVLRQPCRLILVGDEHQQIYRFRGALNALGNHALSEAERLYLTRSFRFGPNIAATANVLLRLKGETVPLQGHRQTDRVSLAPPTVRNGHQAWLFRTVAGVIQCALDHVAQGARIFWVGGVQAYQLDEVEDLYRFSKGERDEVKNRRLLSEFGSYAEYRDTAEETGDVEMKRYVSILRQHRKLPDKMALLRRNTVWREEDADITVSTAHRCKGLEWDTVCLGDDFPDLFTGKVSEEFMNDELNLLYVAATRAVRHLVLNPQIRDAIDEARDAMA